MQSFLSDQDITVNFDLSTVEMTVTGVEYRVEDQDGIELVPRGPLTSYVAPATEAAVTIDALMNSLGDETALARTVQLFVSGTGAAAGETMLRASYRIVAAERLPVPEASFQTLAGAEMVALDLINVSAFVNASDSDKTAALMSAHNSLSRLPFHNTDDTTRSRAGTGLVDSRINLNDITASEWAAIDPDFKSALKRAQVIEASELLSAADDQFASLREQGVTSITIGESSRTYTHQRIANIGVSHRALRLLSRYLAGRRIARA
jgi:hypothetical protein